MLVQNKMAPVFSIFLRDSRFDINFLENAWEFNRGVDAWRSKFKWDVSNSIQNV